MSGFWAALEFLTRLRVPRGEYRLESAFVWLPVVGFVLGAILAAVDLGLNWLDFSPLMASTSLVVLLLALSGSLHADGLMDTCDAVFSHASPTRRMEIMRDPHPGAFGVVGLVCVVALKIAAIDALPAAIRPMLLCLVPGLGRWSIVLLATAFPYGRPGGLGAPLKAAASRRALAAASVLPAIGCVLAGPVGIVSGVLALAAALAIGRWLLRLLPAGLTGDCYGAVCEIVEAVAWVSAAPLARALG